MDRLQPTLKGQLLELRPLRPEDWTDLYAAAADPLIWEQHPEKERYREDMFKKFFDGALASGGALVVIDCATKHIIGTSRYAEYEAEQSEVQIGWTFLSRAYWGGVYNRELKQLMIEHALTFVENVVFMVGPSNLRSCKAMEKIGGVRIAPRCDLNGDERVVFRITRESRNELR